jgi:leucyl-tRNA synthetase
VAGEGEDGATPLAAAHTAHEGGRVVNSGPFDGMTPAEAKRGIVAMLAERGEGRAVVNYRLHDWCISRQRYWGPPIPIIYCDACGMQQVPEGDLPVVLPNIPDFKPDDSGVSPLARHEEWYHVPCPECGRQARRETDVSDTFLDSAWYFLRYPSANRADVAFDPALTAKWLPVNSYIGGNEHAVLHLLYSRFVTMVLHDMGYLGFEEPFTQFRAHGLIIKDGAKMSKSKGNIINPDEYIDRWGADAFRTYLMFLGPFEQGGDFRSSGISGVRRFLDRLWGSAVAAIAADAASPGTRHPDAAGDEGRATGGDPAVLRKLHQTIKKVTEDVARLSYNTAVAAMMEYMNTLRAGERTPVLGEVVPLVTLVAPFAPHVAEELWERLGGGGSVFDAGWPSYDPALTVAEVVKLAVQVGGKLRGTVELAPGASQDEAVAAALAMPEIAKWVPAAPKKVVFVPGRLLNLVV